MLRCRLVDGIDDPAPLRAGTDHDDDARAVACADEDMLRHRRAVDEVPGFQAALLAFDYSRRLAEYVGALALATLGVGNAITLEAGLSFLGLGVQPPASSWGSMIASGRDTVVNAPWVGLAPGIALVLVVVGCTLVADGVREG